MGLLDDIFKGTGDPQRDAVINQGLLSAGLALMQSRGKFLPALGAAGAQGMQASMALRQQQRQNGMQDWQFNQQKQQAARQQQLQDLPKRFMMPGGDPGMDATGGMETAVEAPNNVARPAGFDMSGYIQAMMAVDPQRALQMQASLKKDGPKFGHAPAGSAIFNEATGAMVGSVPKDQADKTPEALRALALIYGEGSPEYMKAARGYAQKLTTHAPSATMNNYGSPVAGMDPRTGQPAFAVTDKQGNVKVLSEIAPPAKEMPSSMREKFASNEVALQKIDAALGLLDQRPASMGVQNYLPDAVTQRTDPAGVPLRAAVADIAGQKIHDRSGAAVTVGETARLKPYIPNQTDTPDAARQKLQAFRKEYAAMQQALTSGASIYQAAAAQPPAGAASRVTQPTKLTTAEQRELDQLRQRFKDGKP